MERFWATLEKLSTHTLVTAPWLVASALVMLLKYQDMTLAGFRVAERALGRVAVNHYGDTFTQLERSSFFIADAWLGWVFIPLGLIGLSLLTRRRLALGVSFVMAIATALLCFIQSQSIAIVGAPTSYSMLIDAVAFAKASPDLFAQYASLSAMVKFCAILCVIVIAYTISRPLLRHRALNAAMSVLLVSAWGAIATVGLLSPLSETKYHEGLLANYSSTFFELSTSHTYTMASPTPQKLKAAFNDMIGIAETTTGKSSAYGRHAGSDVIVIILETAPTQVMNVSKDNPALTNVGRLLDNAVYSNTHYSTFPYSNLAIYSMLTSWYPTGQTLKVVEKDKPVLPSFINPLVARGYQAQAFLPCSHSFPFDEIVYEKTGLSEDYIACETDEYRQRQTDNAATDRQLADVMIFDKLKHQIQHNHDTGQKYAYVIAPQLGHGPWLNFSKHPMTTSEKGKALVAIQDKLIGEVIDLLAQNNKLDDTVIVITGDHGVRTRKEDPTFPGNVVDEYSFNVPLIIHAPNAPKKGAIPQLTSHIDIAPSVMELMGVSYPDHVMQGRSVYLPPIARKVYFSARHYLGADAFYHQGQFYSKNHLTGERFLNPARLDFKAQPPLPADGSDGAFIEDTINDLYAFQNYWQQYFFTHPEALTPEPGDITGDRTK
jgi:phosphoglycerol transferase MdoB-like AlkP superfamily enzyme